MIYFGDTFTIYPTLGHFGACITDPPIKVAPSLLFLQRTSWLADMRAQCDTVMFTLSQSVSPDEFGPDKIVKWYWKPAPNADEQLNLIVIWGPADLPDEIHEPWYDPGAFNHGSCKPTPLLKILVASTKGRVLDPFMGTGTTGVACKELGRDFVGIEARADHFATAEKRLGA